MQSGNYDIVIEKGSTFEKSLTVLNDDDTEYDLSSYVVDMQIRTAEGDLILDCEPYITIQTPNVLNIDIPASASVNIVESAGEYQIEIKQGVKEYSILRGNVNLLKAIIK